MDHSVKYNYCEYSEVSEEIIDNTIGDTPILIIIIRTQNDIQSNFFDDI